MGNCTKGELLVLSEEEGRDSRHVSGLGEPLRQGNDDGVNWDLWKVL